ncbi:MAG: Uma2 family endonuclease, partial [Gammaproteobacteria bacterium]|nr:Uma2 family endonuclease [Gammaproteobacteria bacterium]
MTEAEYWKKYYEHPDTVYEWHNGYLEEKPVSDQMTYLMYKWLLKLLDYFLMTCPVAELAGLEMGFRLVLPEEINIRRPDLGVVLNDNPVPLLLDDSSYNGTFNVCVEAVSVSAKEMIERDTVTKKGEYAKGGVQEYYILDGHKNHTKFYRLGAHGRYVSIKPLKGGIIRSEVLPGFQFRISDLYKRPSPDEMISDDVYKGFVFPGYSEAKQQAEAATLLAEKEKREREAIEKTAQKEKRGREAAEKKAEAATRLAGKEKREREAIEKTAQKEKRGREAAEKQAREERRARQEAA